MNCSVKDCPVCHPEVAGQELIMLRGEVAHLKVCLERDVHDAGGLREEISEARDRIEELGAALLNAEQSVNVATMTVKNNTIDYHRHLSKMELELDRVSNELRNKTVSEIVTRVINEELVNELELARCQRDMWHDAYAEACWDAAHDAETLVEVDVSVTGEVAS